MEKKINLAISIIGFLALGSMSLGVLAGVPLLTPKAAQLTGKDKPMAKSLATAAIPAAPPITLGWTQAAGQSPAIPFVLIEGSNDLTNWVHLGTDSVEPRNHSFTEPRAYHMRFYSVITVIQPVVIQITN